MEPIYIGNKELLNLPKTAFFSSRKITSEAVLKCYDWATEMREKGECVISGFHSKFEKDVFHFLSKGTQPIIVVFGRKPYKTIPAEFQKHLDEGRLLLVFITPATRQSKQTALLRNRYIIEKADKIVFGTIYTESSLYPLYRGLMEIRKTDVVLL